MKKISVAILSACLLFSAASAVGAAPAKPHAKHEHKVHTKSTHKMHHKKAPHHKGIHTKSIKAKGIKTKATQMPKTGFGGASEQTE